MRVRMRKAGVACGSAFAAVVLGVSSAASGWAASTALVIGGIGTPTMHDVVMSQLLGGALSDVERVSVDWPAEATPYTGADDLTLGASIDVGITNLSAEIDAALARLSRDEDGNVINGERVTVVGLSAGSLVVTEVLRLAAADPDAPDGQEINFVVVADSSRQEIIDDTESYNPVYDYTYRPAPETVYDTIVVTGEYDGFADFPDRWWNLNAVANAMAGALFVHVPTMFADLTEVPAENITVDVNSLGGSTTHYLIPAERLPLVQMFPSLAPREAELKASIDKAYIRNDPAPSWLRSLATEVPEAVEDTVTPATEEATSDAEDVQDSDSADLAEATVDAVAVTDDAPSDSGTGDVQSVGTDDGVSTEADDRDAADDNKDVSDGADAAETSDESEKTDSAARDTERASEGEGKQSKKRASSGDDSSSSSDSGSNRDSDSSDSSD